MKTRRLSRPSLEPCRYLGSSAKVALYQAVSLTHVANMSSKRARAIGIILPHLRVAVFLALARCQIACNQYPEAAMTLQDGRSEFASSPDLDRIEVAEAQLHLAQGDVDSAIKMLKV